jgi:hypothetical protein
LHSLIVSKAFFILQNISEVLYVDMCGNSKILPLRAALAVVITAAIKNKKGDLFSASSSVVRSPLQHYIFSHP